jgi:D-amino peptidase
LGIPVVFLSGDKGICEEVKRINKNITTVAVSEGKGGSSTNIHPNKSVKLIRKGMEEALKKDFSKNILELPKKFTMEIRYKVHRDAYKYSFYPGVVQSSYKNIVFETEDYFEILRAKSFLI